ncbi:peptidoglycan-binding domain-containing protein [Couchioplanes caeruleus]|uniref:peptidoglycan-binding domain-containing protein n=1 Tax=Couchioplanes caeruleus TaxID=56438 RepID=UPI001B8020BA|nr:peptidoglycan-binding domain-containing protein [Couchioplanes caeruleus]
MTTARIGLVAAALVVAGVGVQSSAQAAEPTPPPGQETTAKPRASSGVAAIRDCIDVANRDVGRGDTGNYVREVQCLLNWAINPSTFALIAVDGSFGPQTEAKVKKFQTCANALGAGLSVDGRVGPRTAPHLEWWAAHSAYIC